MPGKTCSRCHICLPLTSFWPSTTNRDGLRGVCKKCVQEQTNAAKREKLKRTCRKCGKEKCSFEFSRSKNPAVWCKLCCALSAAKWRSENPERVLQQEEARSKSTHRRRYYFERFGRTYRMLKTYGISVAEYDRRFDEQGGVCAICLRSPSETNARWDCLSVDHCHLSGKVRGLLCAHCNQAIGMFRDSSDMLKRALRYLEAGPSTSLGELAVACATPTGSPPVSTGVSP
jgi:hypothetical protein